MPEIIKIKKGLNLRLKGKAQEEVLDLGVNGFFAIKPTDFTNITPKLLVNEMDEVYTGTPLFYSKADSRIKFCSPVSGKVKEIIRGEKRKLLEIIIESDGKLNPIDKKNFSEPLHPEDILQNLLEKGYWAAIRQRPFNIVANPDEKPKAIFISGFDSSPLAPNYEFIFTGRIKEIQKGIDVLKTYTNTTIHFSLHQTLNGENSIFKSLQNVELHTFSGPHPSGNIGTQIHHIDPINKGDIIWTINLADIANIGEFYLTGEPCYKKTIAVAGSETETAKYFNLISGASIKSFSKNIDSNTRIISGNVLTGTNVGMNGYLGYYENMVTIIPEGDYYEFFGWMMPGFNKLSLSRTFWSWLTPNKEYNVDTNYHGELRNFVVTGQYEKVFPWDIMPQQLIKSMIVKDYDLMEKLGILEVAEEDFALCEFVCTSKIELQEIVRQSINDYIKEMV